LGRINSNGLMNSVFQNYVIENIENQAKNKTEEILKILRIKQKDS
jgi:alcohol dehydrogenase class IV